MIQRILFFIISLVLVAPSFPTTTPLSKNQPNIKILSDEMDCDQTRSVCVAKGNATAEKLGEDKVKILKADQITAHFAKDGGAGPMKITRLEAVGNVFFIIGDISIQGKRGNYITEEDSAEVFDDVKITNRENQLEGGYGKVYLKTGQYTLKNNGERVQALIFTKDKNKAGTKNAK